MTKRTNAQDIRQSSPAPQGFWQRFFTVAPHIGYWIFACFLIFTLFAVVLVDKQLCEYYWHNALKTPNTVLVCFSLLFVFASAIALGILQGNPRTKRRLTDKEFLFAVCLSFAAVFFLQLILSNAIWFKTDWDVKWIVENAENIAYNGADRVDAFYFSTYPNNFLLVYTEALILKLGTLFLGTPYLALLWVNALVVCVSVLLATLTVYRLTRSRGVTVLSMLVGICMIALSPWIVIPYSDTFGMLLPTLAMYCYVHIQNRCIKYFAVVLCTAVGYLYKPTVIILLIALLLVSACKLLVCLMQKTLGWRQLGGLVLSVVLAFGCFWAVQNTVLYIDKTELDETRELSVTHFFMMGSNRLTEGQYSQEDVNFSVECPDTESRSKANIEVALSRIKEMGVPGYVKHLLKKDLANYNNGSFGWGQEGSFYVEMNQCPDAFSQSLRDLYYSHRMTENNYLKFATAEQVIWLAVLFCVCCGVLGKRSDTEVWLGISLLGVSIFLLLFECRSRYLFLFTPLFLTMAGVGLHKLSRLFCRAPSETK